LSIHQASNEALSYGAKLLGERIKVNKDEATIVNPILDQIEKERYLSSEEYKNLQRYKMLMQKDA
jgi:uncharacterized protein HemY